jgi:hypothetical protein
MRPRGAVALASNAVRKVAPRFERADSPWRALRVASPKTAAGPRRVAWRSGGRARGARHPRRRTSRTPHAGSESLEFEEDQGDHQREHDGDQGREQRGFDRSFRGSGRDGCGRCGSERCDVRWRGSRWRQLDRGVRGLPRLGRRGGGWLCWSVRWRRADRGHVRDGGYGSRLWLGDRSFQRDGSRTSGLSWSGRRRLRGSLPSWRRWWRRL